MTESFSSFCLQNCDLTGCELQHANLRGSNLTGAILKEIVAPLHMSQTVNVTTVSIQVDGAHQQQAGQGQGQGPAQQPLQQQPPHHPPQQQRPHHQGAPTAQLQQPSGAGRDGGGGNGSRNGDQHVGHAQEQAQQQDNA